MDNQSCLAPTKTAIHGILVNLCSKTSCDPGRWAWGTPSSLFNRQFCRVSHLTAEFCLNVAHAADTVHFITLPFLITM